MHIYTTVLHVTYVNVVLFIVSVEVIKQFEVKQRCILHFKHFILKTSLHLLQRLFSSEKIDQ